MTTPATARPEHSALSQPFHASMLSTLNKGGRYLTYVPVSEVIARLNRSIENWSVTEADAWRDPADPDWVIGKVTLTAVIDGHTRTGIGYGGVKVKRTKQNEVVDLGDEFKGATSDALKKAAQQFGVGLDLARNDDAMQTESLMDEIQADRDAAAVELGYNDAGHRSARINAIRSRMNLVGADKADEVRAWMKDQGIEAATMTLSESDRVENRINGIDDDAEPALVDLEEVEDYHAPGRRRGREAGAA